MGSSAMLQGVGLKGFMVGAVLCGCALSGCAAVPRAEGSGGSAAVARPEVAAVPGADAHHYDVHDFDFLLGDWDMVNRRLAHRGVGSNEWIEFPSRSRNLQYLNGLVNTDEVQYPNGISGKNDGPYSGLAVRTFDVKKKMWSIYWVSGTRGCCLTDPVEGGFTGDRGEFYGTDTDDGRPVKVRFIWTRLGPDTAHWEQAFDYGDGKWEKNWENTLTRRH